ncbi:MAG: hypothetical protein WCS37_00955 [Chloroflexota bacterium]
MILIHKVLLRLGLGLWLATLFLLPGSPDYTPVVQAADDKVEAGLEHVGNTLKLTIGNQAIRRVIELGPQGAKTTAIFNRFTGVNYLANTRTEFRLVLSRELAHEDRTEDLTAQDFTLTGYNWIKQEDTEQQISFNFQASFQGTPVNLALYYQVEAKTSFIRKWFKVAPFQAQGWAIKWSTLEDWNAKPEMTPLGLFQRYGISYSNGHPKIAESDINHSVITTNPDQRFAPTALSRQAMLHTNNQEGLFFFQESLFGDEQFKSDGTLGMGNADFVDPIQGFSSGKSVLGTWLGSPEIGVNRYNDYILNHYAIIKGKPDPVWFSTWYIYENQVNESNMLDMLGRMQSAGYYDLLHLDAGWEENAPLQLATSAKKFPNGLSPLLKKMKTTNYSLGIWMNPFSGRYQGYTSYAPFYQQNPQWIYPSPYDPKSDPNNPNYDTKNDPNNPNYDTKNAKYYRITSICPLSGAGDYVRNQLLDLARKTPLDEIYWDGTDWHLGTCRSPEQGWRTPDEEVILTIKYYAKLLDDLRAIRPNLRVVLWSPPPDIHWLAAVDQLQLSDMYTPKLGESERVRRQELYFASLFYPNSTIWGDWYGLSYGRSREDGVGAPINLLKFAEMTQLGNGATQAGGSFDLANAPPELFKFVGKMFTFRKAFAQYFNAYQHILNFPDGKSVDGEAHLINGQGFLLLYNPSNGPITLKLPLDEPSLELNPSKSYTLSDWSNLESGQALTNTSGQTITTTQPSDKVFITVQATDWKIIGVDVPLTLPKK